MTADIRRPARRTSAKPASPTGPQVIEPVIEPVATVRSTWRRRFGIACFLGGCIAGVLAISYFVLLHQSLRLDESQSLWQTAHSVSGTLRVVAGDVHVPLYHMILHFWQIYVGTGIIQARLLSLIFFVVSIPVMYLLARQILTTRWSLFATALFSFSPFMNWYGNEARMYSLLTLVTILSQYFFLRIYQRRGGWLGYSVTALFGIYTHYFFFFVLGTQGLFFLFNRKHFKKGSFVRFVSLAILLLAAISPWLWYFHSLGSASNTKPLIPVPTTVDFFNAFSQFLYGFQTDYVNTILISCWPLIVIVAFLAVNRGQRVDRRIAFLVSMAFVPVVLAFGLSYLVKPFFLSRYLIPAVPPLIILVAWLVSHYRRRLAALAAALILLVVGATSFQQDYSRATPVKEDYRTVASQVSQQARPQDIVAISSPFTIYPFEYYYHGQAQLQTLPQWDRISSGAIPAFNKATLPAQVRNMAKNHQYIYLVQSYDQGYEKDIKLYFDTHYARTQAIDYSPDLHLYVYRVGYNMVPEL